MFKPGSDGWPELQTASLGDFSASSRQRAEWAALECRFSE
jgi:hypothetical protein